MLRTALILSSYITAPVLLLCALDVSIEKSPAMKRFVRWMVRVLDI